MLDLQQRAPTRYTLRVKSGAPFLLASPLPRLPSWKAWRNGRRIPTVPVCGHFLGIRIPAGECTLEVRYVNTAFHLGALAGILSLLICLWVAWTGRRTGVENPPEAFH